MREGMRGDYAGAILVPRLVPKGQGNQLFAEIGRWHHV